MKAYVGAQAKLQKFLTLVSDGQLCTMTTLPNQKDTLQPTKQVAPESVWVVQRREKSLTHARKLNKFPQFSGPQPSHYNKYAITVCVTMLKIIYTFHFTYFNVL
jgi:hypothetical protein